MTYYHGSSSALISAEDFRLRPPAETGRLSEQGRNKNLDRVFFTCSAAYARIYAAKAAKKFGGRPIVRRAIPIGDVVTISAAPGRDVHHAPGAWLDAE